MMDSSTLALAEGPVHFMGISGAGMVSLAELLLRSGVPVTGCDLRPGPAARALAPYGVEVLSGHDPAHLEGTEVLVVSAAIPIDHPEIAGARKQGIPVVKRARALGEWVSRGTVVAVAGTHGKTTTTAMTTEILTSAGLDPTGLVGGRVPQWGSNLRFGGEDLFVVEADEYDRSFHHLHPRVAVVTNLEADHLDIYGDLRGVEEAFEIFLEGIGPEGWVVACGDDHGASRLLPGVTPRARTYGLNPGCQLRASEVREEAGRTRFSVWEDGGAAAVLDLAVPGSHNVRNALGAAAAARILDVGWDAIQAGLSGFRGVGRRFEILGEAGGVVVVDDYAHHPTEIRATLAAARSRFPGHRLVVVFQPHLFTRTRDFAPDFGQALAAADELWVTEIYPAREKAIEGVTGMMVARSAMDAGASRVFFHGEITELPTEMLTSLHRGDICITMGAGSVESLGEDLLSALEDDRGGRKLKT